MIRALLGTGRSWKTALFFATLALALYKTYPEPDLVLAVFISYNVFIWLQLAAEYLAIRELKKHEQERME